MSIVAWQTAADIGVTTTTVAMARIATCWQNHFIQIYPIACCQSRAADSVIVVTTLRDFRLPSNMTEAGNDGTCPIADHTRTRLSRRALLITETELKLIAAAAIIGLSSRPKTG